MTQHRAFYTNGEGIQGDMNGGTWHFQASRRAILSRAGRPLTGREGVVGVVQTGQCYGSEYLVRGGEFEVIEGELGVRFRIAVLRLWVSSSQIRQWQRPVEITPQRGREKRVEV